MFFIRCNGIKLGEEQGQLERIINREQKIEKMEKREITVICAGLISDLFGNVKFNSLE